MQRNRLSKNNKGVTLVEVIAVIAVLGVVMAAVTGFMITGAKMSAKVSNQAKLDIRQQTAVEFINQRLWEADAITFSDENLVSMQIDETTIQVYRQIDIDGKSLLTEISADGSLTVCYNYNNDNGVELCEGTIYFSDITDNTITYYLNDTEHIVHFRAGIIKEYTP